MQSSQFAGVQFSLLSSAVMVAGLALALTGTPAVAETEKAIFAGGCFWCMEEAFDKIDGVQETISGYSGGHTKNPTYEQVGREGTGHAEVVEVTFDNDKVSYKDLLYVFWRNIDPFAANRQFCDEGESYRSALFPLNDQQQELAEASKADIAQRFDQPIVTEITSASPFYPAEDYHQNYHNTNPIRYTFYKNACGRPERLKQIWGDEAMPHEVPHAAS